MLFYVLELFSVQSLTFTFLGPLRTVVQVSSAWGIEGRELSCSPMFPEEQKRLEEMISFSVTQNKLIAKQQQWNNRSLLVMWRLFLLFFHKQKIPTNLEGWKQTLCSWKFGVK